MAMELPDNIREKMVALQQMAERGTLYEAEVASAKLAKLLQRWGLNNPPKPGEYEKYGVVDLSMDSTIWRKHVLAAASHAAGTHVVFNRRKGVGQIVGTEANIELTKYTYTVLERTINNLAASQDVSDRAWRNSFRFGCATAISKKMREARTEANTETVAPESKALIIRRDADLSAAVRRAFPRLGKMSAGGASNRDGFNAGYDAGRGISVNPGVAAGSGVRRLSA